MDDRAAKSRSMAFRIANKMTRYIAILRNPVEFLFSSYAIEPSRSVMPIGRNLSKRPGFERRACAHVFGIEEWNCRVQLIRASRGVDREDS